MGKIVNVVIDFETWGTKPGYDARSIGACVLNVNTGDIGGHHREFEQVGDTGYEFYVACSNRLHGSYSSDHYTQQDLDKLDYRARHTRSYRLKRDAQTVDWWYSRPADAQAAFANPVDLKEALERFSLWLTSVGVNPKDEYSANIWGHGANFDPPFAEALFDAVNLPLPWHYRAARDTRTVFDSAGIRDHSEFLSSHRRGVFHHALDDSLTEASAIHEAISIIKTGTGQPCF